MGKRNRIKLQKRRTKFLSPQILNRCTPNPREIIESKERFTEKLKLLSMKYLKYLKDSIELRKQNLSPRQLKLVTSEPGLNFYEYFTLDISDEFTYIFSIQVNKFINAILFHIREIYQNFPKLMKLCMQDSKIIIELSCKEYQKLTYFMYNNHDNNDLELLFTKKITKDSVIKNYFKEVERAKAEGEVSIKEVLKVEENTPKKKIKKKKKQVEEESLRELDKEIEDFKNKLESENVANYKVKPNFSENWIDTLRKRIKKKS